jgi:hypothetical protein
MQLLNETRFAAEGAVLVDAHARQQWVIAVKATYSISDDDGLVPAAAEPICAAALYEGDPVSTATVREAELILQHPGTDVTVVGHAHAPYDEPVRSMEVHVQVADRSYSMRVTGDRYWDRGLAGPRSSDPEPFVTMPISYTRAFGGQYRRADDGSWAVFAANPIGRGFVESRNTVINTPLPNFESLTAPMRSWNDAADVAGTGPIAAGWNPRMSFAGTADAVWATTRAPLAPLDFDDRFFVSAPAALHFDPPLRGGEAVTIHGCSPNRPLVFSLPKLALGFDTRILGTIVRHRAQLDRVIIDTAARRLMTVYRTALALGTRYRSVEYTAITEKRWLW